MRLYHDSKEQGQEVYVPLVIAEEVQIAIPVPTSSENRFVDYQYVEAHAELAEEKYDEPKSDVKVINFK